MKSFLYTIMTLLLMLAGAKTPRAQQNAALKPATVKGYSDTARKAISPRSPKSLNSITVRGYADTSLRSRPAKPLDPLSPVTVRGYNISPDTATYVSKEISIEAPCSADATVFVENIYRRVTIKTSTDNKVRILTTVYYRGENQLTDASWMEKLNLELKGNAANIVVKSSPVNNTGSQLTGTITYSSAIGSSLAIGKKTIEKSGVAVFDGDGNWVKTKASLKRDVILYIPVGAKLDVESKYADVMLENNLREVKANISNASFSMADATHAIITSRYANIRTGNIQQAEIDISNGRFNAGNISGLDINSKYSNIELGTATDIHINSISDQYEIDEVNTLAGHKDYGNLRITSLKESFDLTGSNTDVKIRSIDPSVSAVKIDNKFADMRLPVTSLSNYTVDFTGSYTNVYAPFEKKEIVVKDASEKNELTEAKEKTEGKEKPERKEKREIKEKSEPAEKGRLFEQSVTKGKTPVQGLTLTAKGEGYAALERKDSMRVITVSGYPAKTTYRVYDSFRTNAYSISNYSLNSGYSARFMAAVGDSLGKHTSFVLKCVNCTVDFK